MTILQKPQTFTVQSQLSVREDPPKSSSSEKEDESFLTSNGTIWSEQMFVTHIAFHSAAPQLLGFRWFYLPWKFCLHWDVAHPALPARLWPPPHKAAYLLYP